MRKEARKQGQRGKVYLWLASGLGLFLVIAASISVSGSSADRAGWYHLNVPVPGERVPIWLFTGQRYRGELMPGGVVKLFDPDSEATAIISASLLTEAERLDG